MSTELPGGGPQPGWFVGASFRGTEDQTPRFLRDGIWENHHELDQVRAMRKGDRIAIKEVYTRKYGLPFDNRGESVSGMAIKATGTITENPNDGKRVLVDWTVPGRFPARVVLLHIPTNDLARDSRRVDEGRAPCLRVREKVAGHRSLP